MKKIILLTALIGLVFVTCKKNSAVSPSSDKEIYSFVLPMPSPLPWVAGIIGTDTIIVKVQPGVSLVSITPDIQYNGASISPAIGTPVNFTSPVIYTVTAVDGSTRRYVVIVSPKSTTKQILSFQFKKSDNPALAADAIGQFLNDSTITVQVSGTVDVRNLTPTITHNGMSINPGAYPTDYSNVVYYTVTAEDGSTKKHAVWINANSTVYIGSANGYVYALDAGTGQQIWSFNGGRQMGSPIYYQNKVYVAAQGGSVYCLDALTGASIWSFSNQVTGYTTPCIYNGTVYIGYNRSSPYGDGLYAIDAATGTLLWTKPLAAGVGYGGIANPTAANGYVVITEFNSGIRALNASNGNLIWSRNPGIMMANPLVSGGVAYVGSETSLLTAFDLATGNIIWQNAGPISPYNSPVILNNTIYTGGGLYMYAINKTNGSVIWSEQSWGGYFGLGDPSHSTVGRFSSPAISVSDTSLFAGCDDFDTYCLNLNTGAKKWFYPYSVEIKNSSPNPVVGHGMVVVNREDNSLYAFSAKSGILIWKFTASGAINTDPCMTDNIGNVFYTGNSGNNN